MGVGGGGVGVAVGAGVGVGTERPGVRVGAGVVAVGMGSNLITKQMLDKQDYAGIEAKVRETVQLIKTIRGKKS